MNSPLSHVLDWVEHAKGHVDLFKAHATAYIKSEPCKVVREYGFGPAQHIYKVKLYKPIPPKLSFIASDAIISLRSCLDHVGYATAKAAGKTGRHAHFPFGPAPTVGNDWACGEGRSREIPGKVFDLMMRFQPHQGGNLLLWALNEMCNGAKHELVTPMAFGTGGMGGDFSFPGHVYEFQLGAPWDSAKNELMFARTPVDAPFNYKFKFSTFIALGNASQAARGRPAIAFLDSLVGEVKRIVMAVEAEATRIGLFK